jgi:hypothetical protein
VSTLSGEEVDRVRRNIAAAHLRAAQNFREAFAAHPLPATAYLEMLASALIEEAEGVRVIGPAYSFAGNVITPLYENFDVDRTPAAIFEYWLIISEIAGSASWRMTRVIATREEYDDALRRMQDLQIVRALVASFLPSVEIRDDGTAMLEATVYTRAQEERVERRTLFLDASNEFHFHGRELIAEGQGGVRQ